jgi:peptide/nickel transport system substrate-binding protein
MTHRRTLALLMPLVLSAGLLLSCAPASRPSATGQSTTVNAPAPKDVQQDPSGFQCEPGKEHWRSTGTPKRGGQFVRTGGQGQGALPNLDLVTGGGQSIQTISQVYETLVRPRACYYQDTVMVPSLAKSWDVSADGLTWTLHLRDDARWHNKPPVNGRPFTSADVSWTIEYQKAAGQLRSYWTSVSHEEPDAHTVVLRLPEPDAEFLGKLGDDVNVMVPREVKEQFGDFKTVAVGTGPYMLKDFKPGQMVVVERNPDWRGPAPHIDEIHTVNFGDYTAEVAAARSAQLDLNMNVGFRKLEADAIKQGNPKTQKFDDVAANPISLWVNHRKKPFDDVRVRKAISLAIDRDELIANNRGGAVISGFLPLATGDAAWPEPKVREKFRTDRAESQKLLAEAGFGPGELKFTITTGSRFINDAVVVQQHLVAAGIDVSLVDQGPASTSLIFEKPDWEAAWTGQSPSSVFVDRWLRTASTGDSRNWTGFSDAQLDRLIESQRRELDPAKRKQLIGEAQDRMFESMPYVPAISFIYYHFYSCRVANMPPTHPSAAAIGISEAWLDDSQCQ